MRTFEIPAHVYVEKDSFADILASMSKRRKDDQGRRGNREYSNRKRDEPSTESGGKFTFLLTMHLF